MQACPGSNRPTSCQGLGSSGLLPFGGKGLEKVCDSPGSEMCVVAGTLCQAASCPRGTKMRRTLCPSPHPAPAEAQGPLGQLPARTVRRPTSQEWLQERWVLPLTVLMSVCSVASVMSDSATPWAVTSQAPQSMGFSRQEY